MSNHGYLRVADIFGVINRETAPGAKIRCRFVTCLYHCMIYMEMNTDNILIAPGFRY